MLLYQSKYTIKISLCIACIFIHYLFICCLLYPNLFLACFNVLPLLGTPIPCVRSISSGEISKLISLFLFTTTSSVPLFWLFFTLFMRRQFVLEYCSCLSTRDDSLSTFQSITIYCFTFFVTTSFLFIKSGRDKFN